MEGVFVCLDEGMVGFLIVAESKREQYLYTLNHTQSQSLYFLPNHF